MLNYTHSMRQLTNVSPGQIHYRRGSNCVINGTSGGQTDGSPEPVKLPNKQTMDRISTFTRTASFVGDSAVCKMSGMWILVFSRAQV